MTQDDSLDATPRRDFISQLATGAGILAAAAACAPHANGSAATAAAAPTPKLAPASALPPTSKDGPWNMSWLDGLARAKAKQVFDVGSYQEGGALFYAKNYLNGIRDGWGYQTPDVQIVIGVHGDAYPIVFNDAMWTKYKYGESSKTKDPRTKATSVRNVFWQPREGESMYEYGVDVLERRGAHFILCNNVLRFMIRQVMGESGRSYDDVRSELTGNLLPGVIVVPAMVAAIGMAQANGCSYVYAGG